MDSWEGISFDVLVDTGSGSYPVPNYPTYGSSRHVPNSNHDIIQYTGTGNATVTYSIRISAADYASLSAAFRTIPKTPGLLTVGDTTGDWYLDGLADAERMIDGYVLCSVTFREYT